MAAVQPGALAPGPDVTNKTQTKAMSYTNYKESEIHVTNTLFFLN
jgi:hypothetical protein